MFTEYNFQSHFLSFDSYRMHYLDQGPSDGETVVMVHGNPTWSFYYRHLITALQEEYRVIVPDHIGMGLSDKPTEDCYEYTLARRVADLERLLEHLGAERDLTLVVHDWGGAIGLAYATRYPERVRRLVILNTAAFHLPPHKRFPWLLYLCRIPVLGPLLIRGLNGFCEYAAYFCVTAWPLPREVHRAYVAPYDSWANRRAVLRFVQDIPLRPTHRAYSLISEIESSLSLLREKPTLFCWGLRDFIFDEEYLDQFLQHLPQGEAHRFPDAGHYVLEDKSSEIIALVKDFLARHPL